ncbi:phosphomannomutase/phosphoglucomutase [Candidatus Giovannonibacteria bacterium]|nr:phosphomannomutase/phosphoglucomutase [Candidatus Giovannonibacteria bacterium]
MHKIAEAKFSVSIFKAYDIRGKYPDEINENAVYKIARAFVRYLRLAKAGGGKIKIILSSDARISSPALKESFLDGLQDEGAEVIDAGLTTTPMHYFIVNKTEADGGAMISASHNPAEFNGIKLSKARALPIGEGAGMEEIKNDTMRGIFTMEEGATMGNVLAHDFLEEYIDFLVEKFSELQDCNLKIIADASNGMTSIILRKLFSRFPKIIVEYLHDDLDMTFPNHEADPLKIKNLEDLSDAVIKKHASLGISFDGDGDRIGFIDENGDVVKGDIITALLTRRFALMYSHKENDVENVPSVVYDLRASNVVREEIENLGMRPLESRVGHAFIKQLMRKEDAVFGGELSGHYYFKDFFFCDSAIFAALSLLDLVRVSKESLSSLIEPLKRYSKSEEMNFEVSVKDKVLDSITAYFKEAKISYLDGIKIEFPDWWFNLRPSNTENLVRLNIEAATPELLEEKKKLLFELIK